MRIWKNELKMIVVSCIQANVTHFLSHSLADETDLIVPWPISLLISDLKESASDQGIQRKQLHIR